jgi:hypothetical protein
MGPLTDTVSLRCRKAVGDRTACAVGLWSRTTWPVLGRGRKAEEDERQGEGRATTEGKTWLWHPPMVAPELIALDDGNVKDPLVASWKFAAAWTWVQGGPLTVAKSPELRAWLKEN